MYVNYFSIKLEEKMAFLKRRLGRKGLKCEGSRRQEAPDPWEGEEGRRRKGGEQTLDATRGLWWMLWFRR